MKIGISIVVFVVAVYLIFFRNQKSGLKFWKKAQRNAAIAYGLFLEDDAWHVDAGIKNLEQPSMDVGEWDGPFWLNVPGIGMIQLYGRVGYYEKSQNEMKQLL